MPRGKANSPPPFSSGASIGKTPSARWCASASTSPEMAAQWSEFRRRSLACPRSVGACFFVGLTEISMPVPTFGAIPAPPRIGGLSLLSRAFRWSMHAST